MAISYSNFLTQVRNYTEVDSNVLSDTLLDQFISNVELDIAGKVDYDDLRKYASDRELDAEEILEDIKLWNEQNGNKKKYANLNAFYMNWCRKEARRKPKTPFKVQSHQKDSKVAVRAEKGLSQAQLIFRDNIVAKVEKLQSDPRWAYTNFDRLRNEIEEAMRQGSLNQYLSEKGLN